MPLPWTINTRACALYERRLYMNMISTYSSEFIMMTPYLHFTGGDPLYFKSWHLSSKRAIAVASIALLALAILESLLHATRGIMDAHWRRSALILNTACPAGDDGLPLRKQEAKEENAQDIGSEGVSRNVRRSRIIPPFVLSRDAARGALYSLQASLSYVLMLAVMTFQAAYIISIIVRLGLGEILSGRLATAHLKSTNERPYTALVMRAPVPSGSVQTLSPISLLLFSRPSSFAFSFSSPFSIKLRLSTPLLFLASRLLSGLVA
ncbi:Ctr copper transporter family-domain-containing protein [Russula compacta]|nr:Ctr copper transporter family-domain-containing protein [Russula compacta]